MARELECASTVEEFDAKLKALAKPQVTPTKGK
jgi:hypothetical protein